MNCLGPDTLVKAAAWLSSLELLVRLIALPEGALQGFNDEVLDLDHAEFARECANRPPMKHEEYSREVIEKQIRLMHERSVWKKSSN